MTVTPTRAFHGHRARLYVEVVLAGVFAVAPALLLWRPDWIEGLGGVDPDHGSGSAERLVALVPGAAALVLSLFARREMFRAAAARAAMTAMAERANPAREAP